MSVVSVGEWREGGLPLVDIRNARDGYLDAVHLPFSSLVSGERSCELPPRNVPFAILMDPQEQEAVCAFFGATQSKATRSSRKPWMVRQILVATDALWQEAKQLGIYNDNKKQADDPFPLPRLWQPDSMVSTRLWPLLQERLLLSTKNNDDDDDNVAFEIWDMGSGAGRDVCFLAEQIKLAGIITNVKVVGIDRHKASQKRCLPFWKHRMVEDVTEARRTNLQSWQASSSSSSSSSLLCLYAVRFWNPSLVSGIAIDETLEPGTLFGTSHFCKPHEGAPWDFDHPKEKNVLERHELRDLFSSGWEILHDSLVPDGDHGRTLIQFVARRK